jgi:murein L,D-transpeptidase YcbB/YkuD
MGLTRRAFAALSLLPTCVSLSAAETPRWIDSSGRPNAVAREALALLAGATADGLDPADYRAAQLAAEAPTGPAVTTAAIDWDLALHTRVLRYLRDLHRGRVTPRDLGFRVGASHAAEPDIALTLQAAVDAGRLSQAVDALSPPLAQYRRLRDMLAHYRALAAGAPLAPLSNMAKKVQPGEVFGGAPALQQRLIALGDLEAGPDSTAAAALYDENLADGVRRFQQRHGLDADGVLGRGTLAALNVPFARRVRQIELAMERLRWLPHRSGRPFIAINIPMFRLWAWDAGAQEESPAVQMGVIV